MYTHTHRFGIYQWQGKEYEWSGNDDDVVSVVPQPPTDLLEGLVKRRQPHE